MGRVDVVVNNGRHIGPGLMDNILETPIEQYPMFLMAHGVAPIRIIQLLLPKMLEQGHGTFVTTSSGAGYDFYPARPGPALATESARRPDTRWWAASSPSTGDGIRAFNVNPGFVLTERNSLDADEFGFAAGPDRPEPSARRWPGWSPRPTPPRAAVQYRCAGRRARPGPVPGLAAARQLGD